jgi:DNA-binding response OmpR family regulator
VALTSTDVAAVLLDLHLGREDGVDIARRLRSDHPSVRIAFLTGDGSRSDQRNEAADGFLPKPFSLEELSETVASLLQSP